MLLGGVAVCDNCKNCAKKRQVHQDAVGLCQKIMK